MYFRCTTGKWEAIILSSREMKGWAEVVTVYMESRRQIQRTQEVKLVGLSANWKGKGRVGSEVLKIIPNTCVGYVGEK